MKRSTAAEISTHNLRLSFPFFRMPLMRRDLSNQHQRLIEWEGNFPGTVFYATPCLHSLEEFNLEYGTARVHERSAFFSPVDRRRCPGRCRKRTSDRKYPHSERDGPRGFWS